MQNVNPEIVHPDQESNINDPKVVEEFYGEKVEITGNPPEEPKKDESNIPNANSKDQKVEEKTAPVGDEKGQQPQEKQVTAPTPDAKVTELENKITELNNKIAELQTANSGLQTQIQSYQQVSNLVKAVGLDTKDQNEQAYVIKNLKKVADDMANVPMFTTFLRKFYSGELGISPTDEKGIDSFMPEGETYLESEGYQPGTDSYKARQKFLEHEENLRYKKREFLESIERERETQEKGPQGAIPEGFIKAVKQLLDGFDKTKVELSNVYPITEEDWSKFIEFYRSGDSEIIKSAFGVFANKKSIKSKVEQKIVENKEKTDFVINSKTRVVPTRKTETGVEIEVDEKQAKLYEELFEEKLIE